MRLLLLVVACGAAATSKPDQGMLQLDDAGTDFAVAHDLAGGVDLAANVDLAGAVDLAGGGGDLAGVPAESCSGAPSLVPGVTYDGDTTGFADDYHIGALAAGGCGRNDNVYQEPDAVYAITVPAGKTLTVTVTPQNIPTVWDPALAIVSDCAAAACLAGHDDSNLTGQDEVVTWTNAGADQPVFVIVDSYYHSGTANYGYGRYQITATLQ